RRSGHSSRTVEDHRPGQLARGSVVASCFQAGASNNRTSQRQAGSKSIGGPPPGQAEAPGIHNRGRSPGQPYTTGVARPAQQQNDKPPNQGGDNRQQGYAPDFVGVEGEQ